MSSTRVFQTCPVPGAPEDLGKAFRRDPTWWLPLPAQPEGPGQWNVRLDAGHYSRPALMAVGPPWDQGELTLRTLTWDPVAEDGERLAVERVLPAFSGEIGLRVVGPLTLVVEGSYEPPLGRVGATLDQTLLHKVADRTVRELVIAVAKRLQASTLVANGPT